MKIQFSNELPKIMDETMKSLSWNDFEVASECLKTMFPGKEPDRRQAEASVHTIGILLSVCIHQIGKDERKFFCALFCVLSKRHADLVKKEASKR